MTRTLRIAGLIVIALAASVGPAYADPITAAIAAISTFIATASTATLIAIGAAIVSLGATYIEQALIKKPDPAVTSYQTLQTGGIVPQSFIVGTWSTAGSLCYFNYWGKDGKTPNAHETRVIAISDLPVTALSSIIVDGTTCTYGSGTPDSDLGYVIPEYINADGHPRMWVKFYDGTQTTADAFLVSKFSADANRPYSNKRVGYGRAYAVVTIMESPKLSLSSSSSIKFIVQGVKFYDPREDTSAGGDGDQRFDDASTWSFSENPQTVRYNIRRGIGYGGKWFYGLQNMNASRVPFDNWSAAMNECDLLVDKNAGGQEKQYRCAGEVTVDTEPAAFDESLMRACNARHIEFGGVYKTTTGVIGTPVRSYTDDSFIITEPKTFNQYPGLDGTVNGITAHFPDPTQGWGSVDAPGRFDADLETEDGGNERISDVNYDAVPFAEQVQRLMQSALLEARRWRTHTVVLPHTEWQNEAGDAWYWTSAKNGYEDKVFRVESLKLLPNRDIQATIKEADPSDYDWTPDTDFIPVSSGTISPSPVPTQPMDGWDVEGVEVPGDDDKSLAAAKFYWGTSDIDDVRGILFQVRLKSSAATVTSGQSLNFSAGELITPGVLNGKTVYQGRGKFIPTSDNRDTDWSDWIDFTTPDVRIGADDLYDGAISRAKLDEALKQFQDFVGANASDLVSRLRRLSQFQAESNAAAGLAVMNLRRQVSSSTGALRAEAEDNLTAATGPTSALALAQTALRVDLDALSDTVDTKASASALSTQIARIDANEDDIAIQGADISDIQLSLTGYTGTNAVANAFNATNANVTANAAGITTNASAITSLNASVGRVSASGLIYVSVETTPTGYDSRIGLSASGTAGGTVSAASIFIDAKNGSPSRVMLVGDQVSILNNSGGVLALFTDGGAYFNTAIIKDATIGTLHLENGTVTDPVPTPTRNGTVANVTGGNNDVPNLVSAAHTYDANGQVRIDAVGSFAMTGSPVGWKVVLACIRSDGTQIKGGIACFADSYPNHLGPVAGVFVDDSPVSTANVTYKIQAQTLPGGGPAGTSSLQVTADIFPVQFKR